VKKYVPTRSQAWKRPSRESDRDEGPLLKGERGEEGSTVNRHHPLKHLGEITKSLASRKRTTSAKKFLLRRLQVERPNQVDETRSTSRIKEKGGRPGPRGYQKKKTSERGVPLVALTEGSVRSREGFCASTGKE